MFTNIISEPIFGCYKFLIDFAFKKSKSFFLNIPHGDLRVDDSVFDLFDEMEKYFIEEIPSSSFSHIDYRPGELYIFECNDETNLIIKNKVTSLYDWRLPELPEDLSFVDENGDVWFASISHEGMGWFYKINDEEKNDLKNIIDINY